MKVTSRPLADRFRASSDFEEKLVTRWVSARPGTAPRSVGNLHRAHQAPGRGDLVEEGRRRYAETGVGQVVVPHLRIRAVAVGHVTAAHAARRQDRYPRLDVGRLVHRPAHQQVPGPEVRAGACSDALPLVAAISE